MASDYDLITGAIYREPLELPAYFVANRRFLVGYGKRGRGTRSGFLVASATIDGNASSFDVYADLNRNFRLDRGDRYIGFGDVEPGALGLYESLPVGASGYFASESGFFVVGWNGNLTASGEIF